MKPGSRKVRWTPEKDARLRHLYNQRLNWKAIGLDLGINVWQGQRRLAQLNALRPSTAAQGKTREIMTVSIPITRAKEFRALALARGIQLSKYVDLLLERELSAVSRRKILNNGVQNDD